METNSDSSNSKTEDNTENVTINAPNDISSQQYYNSEFWEQQVDCIIAVLGKLISHNTLTHKHPVLIHSHSPQQSNYTLVQQLSSIHPVRSHQITSCHFSPQYSQSTLNRRLGSNTCTFITLTFSKLYFSSPESLIVSQPSSNTWVYRVLLAIIIGQQFYDKFTSSPGQFYGVHKAALNMGQTRALVGIAISPMLH